MTRLKEIQDRIANAAEILVRRGAATEDTIEGCSAEEIEHVEAKVGCPLPLVYREFLSMMGRGAGKFYVGTDLFYPSMLGNLKAARDLVAEDQSGIVLPEGAIAFMMHQGYQFMFIRAGEGEDPPVHYYMEQSGEFVKKAEQFSQFLIDVAHDDW